MDEIKTGTISKMMRILRFVAAQGMHWNIRTLAAEVGIPRSTVHRLCKVMADNGVLTYDPQAEEYAWGPDMVRIARSIFQETDFRETALRIMRLIVGQCNESAILALYDSLTRKVVFTEQVQCDQLIRYHIPIGDKLPMHAGASGKVILAFLPEDEIEEIIASGLKRITDHTVVDPIELRNQLAEIRLTGWAISQGERTPEAVAIASPIFDSDSSVIGSLLVSIPSYRFQPDMETSIHLLVKEGAEKLSHLLGYHAPRSKEESDEKTSCLDAPKKTKLLYPTV
jgi:DNA-binding IclR family transcriptional regulator